MFQRCFQILGGLQFQWDGPFDGSEGNDLTVPCSTVGGGPLGLVATIFPIM